MKVFPIRAICVYPCLILLLFLTASSQTRSTNVKALVGGTLIDGYGSTPIRNSVVIIEGERIKAVGQVGTLAIPAGAEVISTEGTVARDGRLMHGSARSIYICNKIVFAAKKT